MIINQDSPLTQTLIIIIHNLLYNNLIYNSDYNNPARIQTDPELIGASFAN
jgi:hypothetical protein